MQNDSRHIALSPLASLAACAVASNPGAPTRPALRWNFGKLAATPSTPSTPSAEVAGMAARVGAALESVFPGGLTPDQLAEGVAAGLAAYAGAELRPGSVEALRVALEDILLTVPEQ